MKQFLLAFCVCTSLAFAEDKSPTVVMETHAAENPIDGPMEVGVGDRLVLRSEESGEWDLGTIPEKRYAILEGGKTVCIWTTRPERIRVVLVVARVQGGSENPSILLLKSVHFVDVKGDSIGPDPVPKPDGNLAGDAKAVFDLATEHSPPPSESSKLSENYFEVASKLASGELSADAAVAESLSQNQQDITDREKWIPFFTGLSDLMAKRGFIGDGSAKSDAEYQQFWMAIGGGLKAYANK